MAWEYLDLADYLLIAEAVTGLKAEVLAEMPRVVSLASSPLSVPTSGWQGQEAYLNRLKRPACWRLAWRRTTSARWEQACSLADDD